MNDVGAVAVRAILMTSMLANALFALALVNRVVRAMWIGRRESLWDWREARMLLLKSSSIAVYAGCAAWASYSRIDAGFEWYVVGMAFGSLAFSVYLYLRAGEQVPVPTMEDRASRHTAGSAR